MDSDLLEAEYLIERMRLRNPLWEDREFKIERLYSYLLPNLDLAGEERNVRLMCNVAIMNGSVRGMAFEIKRITNAA